MSRFSQLETTGPSPDETSRQAEESAQEHASRIEPDLEMKKRGRQLEVGGAPAEGVKSSGIKLDADGDKPLIGGSFEEDAMTALNQAEVAYYSGEWDRALRLYSRSLQANATLVRPWVGQVYALLRKRQENEAMTWVNRGLERFPDDPSLLSVRGVVYARRGMHQRAIGSSDYALGQGKGTTVEAWLARGEILLAAGNANADGCFSKALEIDPGNARTIAHIAMAYLDHRKYGSAYNYLKEAAEKMPDNIWIWVRLGNCAERLRYYDHAKQAYERAAEIDPENREARTALDSLTSAGPISRLMRRLRGT